MRLSHFEAFKPVCPRCLFLMRAENRLTLAEITRREGDNIIEGRLHCDDDDCGQSYPILDGMPILMPDMKVLVIGHLAYLVSRDDLSPTVENMLAEAAGPGSLIDSMRQLTSSYAWDHYAMHDPAEAVPQPGHEHGSAAACMRRGLDMLGSLPDGPLLEIGCATGGATFALADADPDRLVIGMDTSFVPLRVAQKVLRNGVVSYARRRIGMVYDRRTFAHAPAEGGRVDFWLCDAMAAPFVAGTFAGVAALNVLDCMPDPPMLLTEVERLLMPGGGAVLACPYDWAAHATPAEHWLGGKSVYGDHAGAAEPLVRSLLVPGAHPRSVNGMELAAEDLNHPWRVRLHDRSTMTYSTHLITARRTGAALSKPLHACGCGHAHQDHGHEHAPAAPLPADRPKVTA